MKTSHDNVKTAENCGPDFGVSSKKGSHTHTQSCEDDTNEQARVKSATEKKEVNIKVCVCSLSPRDILILFV